MPRGNVSKYGCAAVPPLARRHCGQRLRWSGSGQPGPSLGVRLDDQLVTSLLRHDGVEMQRGRFCFPATYTALSAADMAQSRTSLRGLADEHRQTRRHAASLAVGAVRRIGYRRLARRPRRTRPEPGPGRNVHLRGRRPVRSSVAGRLHGHDRDRPGTESAGRSPPSRGGRRCALVAPEPGTATRGARTRPAASRASPVRPSCRR